MHCNVVAFSPRGKLFLIAIAVVVLDEKQASPSAAKTCRRCASDDDLPARKAATGKDSETNNLHYLVH